jgi:AraC family transcriptional regulator, transcriptional activator of pobA
LRDKSIPAFWLYGERRADRFPDALHIETIKARSVVYNWKIQPHRHHDMFQFLLVETGGGETRIDGNVLPLSAGSIVSVPPLAVHEFRFEVGTDGFVASAGSSTIARLLKDEPSTAAALSRPFVTRYSPGDPSYRHLCSIMRTTIAEFSEGMSHRDVALSAHAELIAIGFARAFRRQAAEASPANHPKADLLRRYIAMVEMSFRKHKPLTFYARTLGVSVTHLTRTCRSVVGRSAAQIIQDRLMIEARRDLVYTAFPISQIAFRLGFSDPAYFSRFFAERAGVAPSTYRTSG